MIHNFKIFLMLLLGNFTIAQKLFFFGTFRAMGSGKNYWCLNAGEYTLKEVADWNQYDDLRREYYAKHKDEWPFAISIKGNRPFLIYQSKTRNRSENCDVYTTGYVQADSLEKIHEILRQRKIEYSFLEEPQILHTYNPELSEERKKTIEKNYGELYAKYTFVDLNKYKTAFAEFKNNSAEYAFVIVLREKNRDADVRVLQPQEKAIINLDDKDYELEFFTRKKSDKQNNKDWIDWIKEKVKHHVVKEPDYKDVVRLETVFGIRG